ncbi:MAG: bile acid:sodium symporter family protein [Halioglobus sp.]
MLESLQSLFSNYAAYEYPVASAQLFLAMLGMGALLTPHDFLLEVKKPKALLIGLFFQWAMVPLIAFALGEILPIPVGVAVGLIFVAAVPGGTLSNILTLFGRGNIALSIALTSITTVAALATTPILLQLFVSQYLHGDFSMPVARIARDIFGTLIIPLVIGMWLRSRTTMWYAAQFSKWAIRASLLLILVIVVGSAGSGRLDANAYGLAGVAALVIFAVLVQLATLVASKLARLTTGDGLAIVVEASFRNISLAIAVKATVFPAQPGVLDPLGDGVLFVALLYGAVSMFMALVPVLIHRHFFARRQTKSLGRIP